MPDLEDIWAYTEFTGMRLQVTSGIRWNCREAPGAGTFAAIPHRRHRLTVCDSACLRYRGRCRSKLEFLLRRWLF